VIAGDRGPVSVAGTRASAEDLDKLARGSVTTLAGRGLGDGLAFVTQFLIATSVGAEAFGLYVLASGVVRIAEIVARLGPHAGGMRFVSLHRQHRGEIRWIVAAAVGIAVAVGTLGAGALWAGSTWLAGTVFGKPPLADVLRWLAPAVPAVAGLHVAAGLLQGFHTMTHSVLARHVVQPVAYVGLVALGTALGWGLGGIAAAFVVSNLLGGVTAVATLGRLMPGAGGGRAPARVGALLRYSIPLLLVGVFQYLLAWIDTLVLGALSEAAEVGVYRVAVQLSLLMTAFQVATNSIYAPVAAEIHAAAEIGRLGALLRTATRWVSFGAVPVFVALVLAGGEALRFFGPDYARRGWEPLLVIATGQLVHCLTGGVGFTLTMTGRQRLEALNTAALVVLNVGLSLALVPRLGALGAAIASAGALSLVNVVRVLQVWRLYRIWPFGSDVLAVLAPVAVALGAAPLLHSAADPAATALVTALAVAATITLLLLRARPEDRQAVQAIRARVRRRWR
jgi:O-antigen/teichoic acid export membrane protein